MRKGLAAFALFAGCSFPLVVLVGCSFPHGEPINQGPQDASRVDAPDPLVIDAADAPLADMMMMADASIDGPVDIDTDGDGVLDSIDNCRTTPNSNQRDHDMDGRGDVCDKCPHLPNTADPDLDNDGVGDACDPRQTLSGDSIALFEGFYDASSIATWTETGNGNWSVASGVLTQSVSTTSSTTNALIAPGTVARAAITTRVRLGMVGNGTSTADNPHVSVATGVGQGQSYWCSVVDEGNNDKIYASIFRPNMFPSFPSAAWPGTFAQNSELRITSALLGNDNVCTVVQGTTSATVSGNTGLTTGSVQVATRTTAASFDYVFIVSIGN
jgi:hypothetical protein